MSDLGVGELIVSRNKMKLAHPKALFLEHNIHSAYSLEPQSPTFLASSSWMQRPPWKTRHLCTIYKLSYMRHPETYIKNIYGSYMHHICFTYINSVHIWFSRVRVSVPLTFKKVIASDFFQKSLVSVPLTFKKVSGTENWSKLVPLILF